MTADAFTSVAASFYPCFACTNTCLGGQEIILSRLRSKKPMQVDSYISASLLQDTEQHRADCRLILADLLIFLGIENSFSCRTRLEKSSAAIFKSNLHC